MLTFKELFNYFNDWRPSRKIIVYDSGRNYSAECLEAVEAVRKYRNRIVVCFGYDYVILE